MTRFVLLLCNGRFNICGLKDSEAFGVGEVGGRGGGEYSVFHGQDD